MSNMQKVVNKQQTVYVKDHDEKILVLKRDLLFAGGDLQGLCNIDFSYYQLLIENHGEFLWRSQMEVDFNYKQIIPYLIFNFQDTYFLMRRTSNASEVRLQNKSSLGIGGHLRQDDMKGKNIINWARREFEEEVDYRGNFTVHPLGLLNDDGDDVGKVHVGMVFLLKGDSPAIQIKSELKDGELLTLDQIEPHYRSLESWSKMVYDFIKANPQK